MSNTTKRPWRDEPPPEEGGGTGGGGFRRLGVFFVVLLLTLALVLIASWRDSTGFDALRRYFSYAGPLSGQVLAYDFEADPGSRFARVGKESLLVLTDTSVQLLGPDGLRRWSAEVQMAVPTIHSGGGRAVAYDVGGRRLYVLDEEGERLDLTADGTLICARLNGLGMLAVTYADDGGKGRVSVYDADMELVFTFTSQRRFLADACVTEDGKYLAAATMGQEEGVFVSNVVVYRLTEKSALGNFSVEDALVLSMQGLTGGDILTVTDTCVHIVAPSGEGGRTYSYGGAYLQKYDLDETGYAVLLLGRYASGTQGRLVCVDESGQETASLDVTEEIRDISVSGRYVSVLYTDRCVVYDRDLAVYATVRDTAAIRQILTWEDGSVLMIEVDRAQMFLP